MRALTPPHTCTMTSRAALNTSITSNTEHLKSNRLLSFLPRDAALCGSPGVRVTVELQCSNNE